MKRWLGVVVSGLVLIVLWALPPRSLEAWFGGETYERPDPSPESRAFSRVSREARQLGALYQFLTWGDSLEALARSSLEGNVRWAVAVPAFTPVEKREELETAVRRQVAVLEAPGPTVLVGTVIMDTQFGMYPGVPWRYGTAGNGMVFARRSREAPFCFMVASEPESAAGNGVARLVWTGPDSTGLPNPLGPCAWYAKYGSPGEKVFEWLAQGGYRYARGFQEFWPWAGSQEEAPEVRRIGVRSAPGLSPEGVACASGRREACQRVLLLGDGVEEVRASSAGAGEEERFSESLPRYGRLASTWGMPFGGSEGTIFSDLEAEFGSDQFRSFWTSDQEVPGAFQDAFGLPFEDWLLKWTQSRWGGLEVRPRVPARAGLLTFLTMGVLAGGAILMDRRRR